MTVAELLSEILRPGVKLDPWLIRRDVDLEAQVEAVTPLRHPPVECTALTVAHVRVGVLAVGFRDLYDIYGRPRPDYRLGRVALIIPGKPHVPAPWTLDGHRRFRAGELRVLP